MNPGAPAADAPYVAPELPPHGYVITKPVRGSDIPVDYTFVLTRDEIYVPVGVRKPKGRGPFPVITMGRGDGRGGVPHVEGQIERLVPMQERMLARGYAVVYLNYRNEIPHLYEQIAGWAFGDFVFGSDYDIISDMGKARRAGFCETVDSERMFLDLFARFRAERIIP